MKKITAVKMLLITQIVFTSLLVYKCFILPHTWFTLFIYGISEISVVSVVSVTVWTLYQHRAVQKLIVPVPVTSAILLVVGACIKGTAVLHPKEIFLFFGIISLVCYGINKLMARFEQPEIARYTLFCNP